mmetsp:Transcript_56109/g.114712  ORF Transcript_56109/g.114712 Transcript_56109/m.114712 type:complete len:120 (-) Transcript_56109:99-458(-)|eukprot:CAMPEP_0181310266 /NCGR_PEP_ID=MMETSP1101-20121128/12492_1 /TAXON_ID=46948 /ORGANISM="Rhodomonas abbreviata, Strain Caron Lab Isolate" /LENGTH=119 /DNA_ID=CAMNT_0023416879 /DNA_START=81 /DNA_END=440 /DNA_ORIENTATION=-
MKMVAATARAVQVSATRLCGSRGLKIEIPKKDPTFTNHDSPCAKDAGSYYDEIGAKQFVSSKWDDRTPFTTVELFRHTHKPYAGQSMVTMQRGGISHQWDDRSPFMTANLFQKIRPVRA